MLNKTVKNVVLFGPQELTEYFTSRALDFQGYPTQRYADKIGFLELLRNWDYLKFAIKSCCVFKPLRSISLYFPYEEPPEAFMNALVCVHYKVIDVVVEVA